MIFASSKLFSLSDRFSLSKQGMAFQAKEPPATNCANWNHNTLEIHQAHDAMGKCKEAIYNKR